jgi:hypothetical protein
MKGEQSNGQRAVVVNPEPECIAFIRSKGFNIDDFYLSYFEKWQRKKPWDRFDLNTFDIENDTLVREVFLRDEFINRYGFAILSRRAIEAMRPYAPLVEIGAGSGYWTYELRKWGVDCIATDTMDGAYGFFEQKNLSADDVSERRWQHQYASIEKLNSVAAVRKYPNRNLLTVWPDYNKSWAADALDIFTGQVVIYQGEGYGNATADDRFHGLLDSRFGNQEAIPMLHFEHSYDRQLLICKQPKQLKGKNNNE